MGRIGFIWDYVRACVGGGLPSSECSPLWQFGIIILLLAFAVAGLVVIRVLTPDDPKPSPARSTHPGPRKN